MGKPRSKDHTRNSLDAQLNQILSGAPSAVVGMATATRVKDKYFQHFADQLAEGCAKFKEMQQKDPSLKGREYVDDCLKQLCESMPMDTVFSPSLRLDGS